MLLANRIHKISAKVSKIFDIESKVLHLFCFSSSDL